MSAAPAGSMYAELGAIFDRYLASILSGGPFVLPAGDTAVYVDEAVAMAALRDYDRFLAESEAHCRDLLGAAAPPALAEAFRYQALITARWGRTDPVTAELAHDWPAYVAAGGTGAPLQARPTPVRFVPPLYAAVPEFPAFAAAHIGCIRARLDVGTVEAIELDLPPAPPAQLRPRSLLVLPTSG
jgi:hypothetical protein